MALLLATGQDRKANVAHAPVTHIHCEREVIATGHYIGEPYYDNDIQYDSHYLLFPLSWQLRSASSPSFASKGVKMLAMHGSMLTGIKHRSLG